MLQTGSRCIVSSEQIGRVAGSSGCLRRNKVAEKTISAVVAERRSTPRFAETPVREEDLKKILIAGLESPSGYNLQPWRFVVVRDREIRTKLRAAAHNQSKIEQAPVEIGRAHV